MTEVVLAVRDITKGFGGLTAVSEVSFSVRAGEICGLIGPNGAGKSTLFNLIAGDQVATSGTITLLGKRIDGLPSYRIARMGVARAFQLVHLFETMTALENVLLGTRNGMRFDLWANATHLGAFKRDLAEMHARAEAVMGSLGVLHLADLPVPRLTYGQQRLVATARAIASEPKLLLLDEPAAGLSGAEVSDLRSSIELARQRGAAILLVEHNVPFVMDVCDHVVALKNGRKIADGLPSDVRTSHELIEAYLGTA